jgi:hypothetical protein
MKAILMSLLGLARIDQSLDVFGQLVAPPHPRKGDWLELPP